METNAKSSIYLSLDLDFWMYSCGIAGEDIYDWKKECDYIMSQIQSLSIKPFIVNRHHRLLRHINDNPCDILINMDYHSDLADDTVEFNFRTNRGYRLLPPLNEGTWGNRVKWRKDAKFIWLCPSIKVCYYQKWGRCTNLDDPFTVKKATTWKRAIITENIEKIKWNKIKAIGISLSQNWTPSEVYTYIMKQHIKHMKTSDYRPK